MLSDLIRRFAMKTGRGRVAYRRICNPSGKEYAEFLRRHGGYHSIGEDCYISPNANVPDPAYVKIGNNVRINDCAMFGHDGAVNMVNKAFGLHLDSVGKIDIRDNVFIGYSCVILPGVTIGPNAIVAAGSVVNRDVPEGTIVAGVPAKQVSTVAAYVEKLKADNERYPWRSLIKQRSSEFDPMIEDALVRQRVEYFFPSTSRS
jgi:acetyltransferase-like isoleucine patch superfamily enzyme